MKGREVVVDVSGASGARLARWFVELAVRAPELERLHLILSDSALSVARNEIDRLRLVPDLRRERDPLQRRDSGIDRQRGLARSDRTGGGSDVEGAPASRARRSRVSHSLVAIENMRRATPAGAVVMPPTLAFYVENPSLDRLLDAF